MHLYSLSTHKSYTKTCLISNLLVSSSSSTITISKVNDEAAKLQAIHTQNTFATILGLIPVSANSFCVLSDSGGISILKYDTGALTSTIANFGRTGIRTITPVYAACDPQGRVLLVSAIESERLAYILGVENEINGPIDCSQKNCIVYDLCALDVGYGNPIFCQIERVRGEKTRQIAFYEFDLGLNILRRKQSVYCEDAHLLIPLPELFPGLLVCRANRIEYLSPVSTRPVLVIGFNGRAVCGVVHQVKQDTFAMVQAEDGKIYKINFNRDPELDPQITLSLQYFGTADPSHSMHIFSTGFLYTASQTADHKLYQFISLGEEDPVLAFGVDGDDQKCEVSPIQQEPENLEETDSLLNLGSLTCSRLGSARSKVQDSIIIGNGRKIRSLQSSIEIEELVSSPLPKPANNIFVTGSPSKYIIICFDDDILTLKVEESVSEVKDSGLVQGRTLHVEEMSGVLVQIHSKGIRQVGKTVKDWTAPSPIIACAANSFQILVGLQDNSLIYFEFIDGILEKKSTQEIDSKILVLSLESVPSGLVRANYAAIGLQDTLRVCTIDSELQLAGIQNITAPATSIVLDQDSYMHVGLENGVYMQSKIDRNTGSILSTKSRFLGSKPAKIRRAWVSDEEKYYTIAISDQSWLTLAGPNFNMVPLSLDLTSVDKFITEDTPQALAAISKTELKIFSIENTKNRLKPTESTELSSIPRRFMQAHGKLYTLLPHAIVVDGKELAFEEGVTGIAIANCRFDSRKQDYLVVSAARNLRYEGFEQRFDESIITVYQYPSKDDIQSDLSIVHSTTIPVAAHSLAGFKGMLLVGAGPCVVMYDIGIKQLLKKKTIQVGTKIVEISVNRNRVFVADSRRSVTVLVHSDDGFILVADDAISRAVSTMTVLDLDTVAIGDRFGTFSILRVPKAASELSTDPQKLPLLAAKAPYLNGAHFKLELVATYYLGDVVSGIHLGVFAPGAFESLLWCGVQGNMGALIPMNDSDTRFFSRLETELRKQPSVLARSHLSYRGYAAPPKNVVDGELCEQFGFLDPLVKSDIAQILGADPEAIETRVAEFRVRYVTMQ